MTTQKPSIFISCGQWARTEIELGQAIGKLVEELTHYRAYFAQNQSSLEGVTNHILRALNESVGLIAILHPRGSVARADGTNIVRASVWIEQEIAIAAFINQVLERRLKVQAYVHESIVGREDLREQLLLNPRTFLQDGQVLDDLRETLPRWAAEIAVKPKVQSLQEGLAELVSSGSHILVGPAILFSKAQFDSYVVVEANDRTAQLKNVGSGQSVIVPLGRMAEIVWRGERDKPMIKLNGRLQWLTLQQEWKFFSECPRSQDEKEFGFGKPTSASDRVMNQVCGELKARGYQQLARFSPQQMQPRLSRG